MLEKRFYAVPPQLFTADGTTNGTITISGDACQLFKVKMRVLLNATGLPTLLLEIKEIDNEDNVQVGPIAGKLNAPGANTGITARTDVSAYTVALGANISADEQRRPDIDWSEAMRAMYDEEPSVAMRSILVDQCGDRINNSNPLPVAPDLNFKPTCEPGPGEVRTADTLHCQGVQGVITVGTIPVPVRKGITNRTGRKSITVVPLAKGVFWGFESNVDTTQGVNGGTPLGKNQPLIVEAEDNTDIYLVSNTPIKVAITEA